MSFKVFAKLVHDKFQNLAKGDLFVSCVHGDVVYDAYQNVFPEGTNEIYKVRREHDCSCCNQFIRNIGNVVSIADDLSIDSIWNIEGAPYPYNLVAARLHELVTGSPIATIFNVQEPHYGAETSKQLLETGEVINWNHFYARIPSQHVSVGDKRTGDFNTSVTTLKRSLKELTLAAVDTTIDLIAGGLYRGEEHLPAVKSFRELLVQYTSAVNRTRFVLKTTAKNPWHFRNTAIGTLVSDISEGVGIEQSARSFEAKVAPANYKRNTALVTTTMIKHAMETIELLGVEPALHRRHATTSDVSINNVIWADYETQGHMKSGIEALLTSSIATGRVPSGVQDISIEDFVTRVVPKAKSVELLVTNEHLNKFVSVTAPIYEDVEPIFKWNNNFAWSYSGNIADSIKERVKRAGGNTEADFRVSLSWFNYDDLDLHAIDPTGTRIYFGNKKGILDVDMNAGRGETRTPVENLAWVRPKDGTYTVQVNQYNRRETSDVGFELEIELLGKSFFFSYPKAVSGTIEVCKITFKNGQVVSRSVNNQLIEGKQSTEKWGLTTNNWAKLNMLMLSPNHWDTNSVGNKHWFFIVDKCASDEPTRGIYNEFLNSQLSKHGKVFELLGNKTTCDVTTKQLSGLGFSSTQRDTLTVKVAFDSSNQTVYNINF